MKAVDVLLFLPLLLLLLLFLMVDMYLHRPDVRRRLFCIE